MKETRILLLDTEAKKLQAGSLVSALATVCNQKEGKYTNLEASDKRRSAEKELFRTEYYQRKLEIYRKFYIEKNSRIFNTRKH